MERIVQSDDAHFPILHRHGGHHQGPGPDFPRGRAWQAFTDGCDARRPPDYGDSKLTSVLAADDCAEVRWFTVLVGNYSAHKSGIPGESAHLPAAGWSIRRAISLAAPGSNRESYPGEWSARRREHYKRDLHGLVVQLSSGAGAASLPGLRVDPRRAT